MSIFGQYFDIFEVYVDLIDTFVNCVENPQKFDINPGGSGIGDIVTGVVWAHKLCRASDRRQSHGKT